MKIAKYKYKDNVSYGHYVGSGEIIDLGSSFVDIFDLLNNKKRVNAYFRI